MHDGGIEVGTGDTGRGSGCCIARVVGDAKVDGDGEYAKGASDENGDDKIGELALW